MVACRTVSHRDARQTEMKTAKGVFMVRAILIVMSLLLAAADFILSKPVLVHAETGRIIFSLAYGFTPALFGLIVAWIKRLLAKWRNWPDTFARDWNWVWGVLLAVLVVRTLLRSLPY